MKNIGKNIQFYVSIGIAIIWLGSCTKSQSPLEIAISTRSLSEGTSAIEKLTSQNDLYKVALEAETCGVRRSAVKKINDQTLLKKIALTTYPRGCRPGIQAIRQINDPSFLIKLAFETPSMFSRYACINKLLCGPMLVEIENLRNDREAHLFYMMASAFNEVPAEHRAHHFSDIFPVMNLWNHPKVINEIGEVASVEARWESRSAGYTTNYTVNYPMKSMLGEWFQFTIRMKNTPEPIRRAWETRFPESTISTSFQGAPVKRNDLYSQILNRLSQPLIHELALEGKDLEFVRYMIMYRIKDQEVLARIIKERSDSEWLRETAIRYINDTVLLNSLSINDKDKDVRLGAQKRLEELSDKRNTTKNIN